MYKEEKTMKWSVKKLVTTAMLAAVAGVLMSLEFSIPFMPVFYKVDFSDVPTVIALFSMGPASAMCVEIIKILIKLITVGTNSNYVGEFSNLIGAFMFILPIWLISKKTENSKKGMFTALAVSGVIRIAWACFCNAFITLPMYAASMGISIDDVVRAVSSANPAIQNLNTFIILATIPFNFIKIGLNYVIATAIFYRVAAAVPALRGADI
jgi:riboflavin transporter FmnP